MKHKNMKQYEEKNAPMLNHDITLEEIEAACRAHQKENDNRNMAEECRTIAREQKGSPCVWHGRPGCARPDIFR